MASNTHSKRPLIPETQSATSDDPLFTLRNIRKLQTKGLTVAQASKEFGGIIIF